MTGILSLQTLHNGYVTQADFASLQGQGTITINHSVPGRSPAFDNFDLPRRPGIGVDPRHSTASGCSIEGGSYNAC